MGRWLSNLFMEKRRLTFLVVVSIFMLFSCSLFAGEPAAPVKALSSFPMTNMTGRMMQLVLQLGVILFAARIGNIIFSKLKMPSVLGELCAGVLIGPYALGMLPVPGFPDGLFSEFNLQVAQAAGGGSMQFVVSPELYGICTLASIILLFMSGLETDLQLFLRYSVAGSLVGLGGVIFSFVFGVILGIVGLPLIVPGTYTFLHPECVFLGVLCTATSVSITARILSEKRQMDSPEGVTILAGAVIDDVLGIIMLAIGMGIIAVSTTSGTPGTVNWAHIGGIALKAFGIWLGATVLGILSARRIGSLLKKLGGPLEIAILSVGLALIVSGLFEKAKLSMIIGSYVMGLSFSRADISHTVREHLQGVSGLLVPVFFVVMGMMVDLHALASPKIVIFGLIYTILAILAKILGCGLPTFLCGFNLRGALRIGVGMVPRGEVALIIAGIGLSAGFLSKEVFGVAVMMTLLTTLLAPPLLVGVFASKKRGLRASADKSPPSNLAPIVYSFPSTEIADFLVNSMMGSFHQEGFFATALNVSEGLYQARKDDKIINFRRSGNQICFEAPAGAESVIRMMMLEAIVAFEQSLTELRKPLGTDLRKEISEAELVSTKRRKTLERTLRSDLMVPSLKGSTKHEVIAELIDLLVRQKMVRDRDAALDAVMKREDAMSTGLRHGIASPHARTDAVDHLVCVIGLKSEGVDFEAVDGAPSTVIVLTLSPSSSTSPYMEFMSSAMAALREDGKIKALLSCGTSGEMLKVLLHK